MAEVASGKTWHQLFRYAIADPLGLMDPELKFLNIAEGDRRWSDSDNPLVAGGLQATTSEYMRILGLVATRGELPGGRVWVLPHLIDDMFTNAFPEATPKLARGYGFCAWLECSESQTSCPCISSPGIFGFYPWACPGAGYFAVLAVQGGPNAFHTTTGWVRQTLKPVVEEALAEIGSSAKVVESITHRPASLPAATPATTASPSASAAQARPSFLMIALAKVIVTAASAEAVH
eukprot:TRINITY_DN107704_c0_g1_i1.p1 TRINITY_DN107704_c0_g1~~TRINITY_DN107704_c0_g1_i1.p1  ORF type:complete len:243 (-),score=27.78 TRINITY_DN107704_c0_g1_i1:144-845(-)